MCAVPALAHWGYWVDGNSLPDLTVFRPLDIERYAKRLSLEARGAERGAANQPPADALALDDIESDLTVLDKDEMNKVEGGKSNNSFGSLNDLRDSLGSTIPL